jgi:polyisoprenoid-binding protein YceI
MKKLFLSLVILTFAAFSQAQTTWNCDPSHSSITFSVGYLGISNVTGDFGKYSGILSSTNLDFNDATFDFTVDVSSINTGIDARDNHLKSPDFFDVATYSQMSFKTTSFKKFKKNTYKLEGNMTIKGVTQKMTFEVTYGGIASDNYGNERSGFMISGKVKRSDFQINGGKGIVGDEVSFTLNFNFIKSK